MGLEIRISAGTSTPIYRQIVNQIRYLVASGLLRPGEELPPIRTLAQQLEVTPNTVVNAYDELESAGNGKLQVRTTGKAIATALAAAGAGDVRLAVEVH